MTDHTWQLLSWPYIIRPLLINLCGCVFVSLLIFMFISLFTLLHCQSLELDGVSSWWFNNTSFPITKMSSDHLCKERATLIVLSLFFWRYLALCEKRKSKFSWIVPPRWKECYVFWPPRNLQSACEKIMHKAVVLGKNVAKFTEKGKHILKLTFILCFKVCQSISKTKNQYCRSITQQSLGYYSNPAWKRVN